MARKKRGKRKGGRLARVELAEKKIEREEAKIEKEEKIIEKKEEEIIALERRLERQLKRKPMKHYCWKDFAKSTIGAFAGVVGHFAFLKGAHVAVELDVWRATALLVISYFLGYILMYKAGFRKVPEYKMFGIFPFRVTVTFFIAIATMLVVLFLFGELEPNIIGIFKQVSAISIVAMLGAGIADLAGKE